MQEEWICRNPGTGLPSSIAWTKARTANYASGWGRPVVLRWRDAVSSPSGRTSKSPPAVRHFVFVSNLPPETTLRPDQARGLRL